ncbi:MAG TPA: ferrochelatase [Bacteroidota bacterium]
MVAAGVSPAVRAVVLLQLGGPDSLEAVQPFLYNLFVDPDIIDLPGAFLFRKALARFISTRRAPKVQELYKNIGGRSPILRETQQQADSLKDLLKKKGQNIPVEIAMRYWHPFTEETLKKLLDAGVNEVILLPLYPHYSKATTGSSLREWERVARILGAKNITTKVIQHYFDHTLYIKSLVERVQEAIQRVPADQRSKVNLVFSAHGTPMKLVRDGDPYSHHIRRTYELVVEQGNFGLPHHLCFQSKVGPQKWLQPSLTETIDSLGNGGVTHVIVNPIAFVTDHIETLSEINIEARHAARERGITYFDMTAPLTTSKLFIECLAELVFDKIPD